MIITKQQSYELVWFGLRWEGRTSDYSKHMAREYLESDNHLAQYSFKDYVVFMNQSERSISRRKLLSVFHKPYLSEAIRLGITSISIDQIERMSYVEQD